MQITTKEDVLKHIKYLLSKDNRYKNTKVTITFKDKNTKET